ncbi:MAG: cupin domain-containing protein [Bacilli bacterium]|nr:cupin domain-containing protein [Bacilli bacterium]
MRYLAYLEFSPNKVRGNHYHNTKEENLLVIKGIIKAKYWLLDNNETLELMLEPGDVVNVKPGVAHAYVSDGEASAIEFSPQILDYNDQIKALK